jgi:hypothetical protein
MNKRIFLGALPLSETGESKAGDSIFNPSPIDYSDRIIQLDDTANQVEQEGGGVLNREDIGTGDLVKTDESGDIIEENNEEGGGEGDTPNAGNSAGLSLPLIIGGAALIYFLFLRKKK